MLRFITFIFILPGLDPGIISPAWADGASFPGQPPIIGASGAAINYPSSSGVSCSQSGALMARMDGSENKTAVDALICGMVTDGTYSLLDGLYVFATNSGTNAQLNWAQNAYNLTLHGSETFAANAGYTGNGSTGYFDTGFTPSTAGGQYAFNSANIGGCVLTNRTSAQNYALIGIEDSGNDYSLIIPLSSGSSFAYDLQGNTIPSYSTSTAQGSYAVSRTGASLNALYYNGSQVATPNDGYHGIDAYKFPIGASNINGTIQRFSADQIAYAFFGGGLTSTQAIAIYNRLHTYLAAVGASGC
jgi:hypothetical protein